MNRIVFFDAAGTLLYLPKGVAHHYALVARRHGVELDERALEHSFGAAWKAMPPPVSSRVRREDDDRGWWRELVHRVLDLAAPSTHFDRDAYFAELYPYFVQPGVWQLYPEVIDVLEALRPRYRLGIISNFDARLRTLLQNFGILDWFEVIAISSEIGADKPDPYIFEQALRMAAVPPAEALHAGDDPVADWQAAAAAGLHAFHLDRPKNSLRDLMPHIQTEWR